MRDRIIGSVVGRGHIEAFGKRQNHLGFVGDPLRMQQGGGGGIWCHAERRWIRFQGLARYDNQRTDLGIVIVH